MSIEEFDLQQFEPYRKLEAEVLDLRAENERLKNENYNLAEDLNYHQVILDGSWPSAIQILEKALKKAKQAQKGDQK